MPLFCLVPFCLQRATLAGVIIFSPLCANFPNQITRSKTIFALWLWNKSAHFGPLLCKLAIDRLQHQLKVRRPEKKISRQRSASKRTTCPGVACTANNEVDQSASRRDIDIGKHDISISPPFCSSRQLGWLLGSHAVPRALGTTHIYTQCSGTLAHFSARPTSLRPHAFARAAAKKLINPHRPKH